MKETRATKWALAGFGERERNIVNERIRSKAKGIICLKYQDEYRKIKTKLINDFLEKIKNERKI